MLRTCGGALLVVAVAILRAGAALASDGAIEINAVKAAAGGVTLGDAPGYPVTLSEPGSYRLTGNLAYADPDTTAIEITAVEVTLDLGGFAISFCTVFPPCMAGAGSGVVSVRDGTTVKNGRVSGMGADGIALQFRGRVEDVDLTGNAASGIVMREGSVRRVSSTGNGGDGVVLAAGLLEDSEMSGNGANGASLGSGVSYSHNVFAGNATSVTGGHATGGNVCSDKLCSASGARRFYLTKTPVNGANALSACAASFHMASLWEIHDPSGIFYDTSRGETWDDAGQGVPIRVGWIRTGTFSNATSTFGTGNCNAWTSAASTDWGGQAFLTNDWIIGTHPISPWTGYVISCASQIAVWCVED